MRVTKYDYGAGRRIPPEISQLPVIDSIREVSHNLNHSWVSRSAGNGSLQPIVCPGLE
jgi:hypothetical protein